MIMPFGKHKGKPLSSLPLSYLQWVLDNCSGISPALRDEMRRLLEPEKKTGGLAIPDIAARWYRALATEFHPDKGGSHDAMKAVNRGRDLLLEMAGVG